MRNFRTRVAGIAIGSAAIALIAAGCGSNGSGGSTSAGNASGTSSNSASMGHLVSAATVSGTHVLVAADGHTLYSTVAENGGKIHCVGSCTTFWKPLMASSSQAKAVNASFSAKLGVVNRPDGGTQLTFNGRPLYTFAEEGAHQLKGNGFTDDFQGTHFVWKAATTSGSAASSGSSNSNGYGQSNGNSGYGY